MFRKLCPTKRKMNSSSGERKQVAPPPPTVTRTASTSTTDESDSVSGDSLEGLMELTVHLPDKKIVMMSVEKRMPMMDLLVHVTTANKITPGGHIIKIVNDEDNGFLSYKPSTPIGSLTSSVICIVPKKNNEPSSKKDSSKGNTQPFEPTFRLQVHLPRQQLLVLRVSQKTKLLDIHNMVCNQKGLDSTRYHLQHPHNAEIVLDYSLSLADYNLNEIKLVSKHTTSNNIAFPKENIIIHKEHEEKKKKSLFGMFRRNKSNSGDINYEDKINRSSSSSKYNENHRLVIASSSRPLSFPQVKASKKRPAPPPPLNKCNGRSERPPPPPPLHSKSSRSLELTHSRQSSDSSGYHDSSVLGDSPEGGMGDTCEGNEMERPKSVSPCREVPKLIATSQTDNLKTSESTNLNTPLSTSNLSITTGLKKRRAPLPPAKNSIPLFNNKPQNNDENVSDSNVDPPSLLPLPSSGSGDNEENHSVTPSPSSTPLSSKEFPDVSADCMSGQNCDVQGWDVNLCESPIASKTHLNIEKEKDLENDISLTPVSTTSGDDQFIHSGLGIEDKHALGSRSPNTSLHDLHDNHSSVPLLNVVADETTALHEKNLSSSTSPTKFESLPLDNETIPSLPSTFQNESVEVNNSVYSEQLPVRDESGKSAEKKFEAHSEEIQQNKLDFPKSDSRCIDGDNAFIDKENGEMTEPFIVKYESDFNVNMREERLSISTLSSADEDDVVSSFEEILMDAEMDMIKRNDSEELKENANFTDSKITSTENLQCAVLTSENDTSLDKLKTSIPTIDSTVNKTNSEGKNSVCSVVAPVNNELSSTATEIMDNKSKANKISYESAKEKPNIIKYKRPLMNFSISTYKPRADVLTVNERNLMKSESFNANQNEASVETSAKSKAVRSSSFEGRIKESTEQSADSSRNVILTVNSEQLGVKLKKRQTPVKEIVLDENDKSNGMSLHNTKASSMIELNQDQDSNLRRTQSEFFINTLQGSEINIDHPDYVQLQHEYLKLQNQLLYWQQQLLSNQTLLQRQHILPSDGFQLSPEMLSLSKVSDTFEYPSFTDEAKASTFPKQYDKSKNEQYRYNNKIDYLSQNFNKTAKDPDDCFNNNFKLPQNVSSLSSIELKNRKVDALSDSPQKQIRHAKSENQLEQINKNSLERRQRQLNFEIGPINKDNEVIRKPSKKDNDFVQSNIYTKDKKLQDNSKKSMQVLEEKTLFKNGDDMIEKTNSLPSVKERIKFMEQCGKLDINKSASSLQENYEIQVKNHPASLNETYDNDLSKSLPVKKTHSLKNSSHNSLLSNPDNFNKESLHINSSPIKNGQKFRRQRVDTDNVYNNNNNNTIDDGFSKCLPVLQRTEKRNVPTDHNFQGIKTQPQNKLESAFNKKNLNDSPSQASLHFKEPFTVVSDKKMNANQRMATSIIIGENNPKKLPEVMAFKHTSSVKIDGSTGKTSNKDGISIIIRDPPLPNYNVTYQSSKGNEGTKKEIGKVNGSLGTKEISRDNLLQEILNFGGLKNLKRVPK